MGSGGEGLPEGSEVSFLKTIQSIWKWIHFTKMSPFFFPKRSIFKEKYRNIEYILQKYLNFFEKLFFVNFHFLWYPRNSLRILISNWEIYEQSSKNSLYREGLLKMAWKFLTFFGENRLEFREKSKFIEIWWMISIAQVKISNLPAKLCPFGPKMKRILKIFKKILRFFDRNLNGKLTFFTIFY